MMGCSRSSIPLCFPYLFGPSDRSNRGLGFPTLTPVGNTNQLGQPFGAERRSRG